MKGTPLDAKQRGHHNAILLPAARFRMIYSTLPCHIVVIFSDQNTSIYFRAIYFATQIPIKVHFDLF